MGKIYTADNFVKSGSTGSQILAANGDVITAGTNITISGGLISTSITNVSIGTNANGLSVSGSSVLELALSSASATGALSSTDYQFFYNKQNALTNPVTGTGDVNKLPKFTGSGTIGSSIITDSGAIVDILANSSASIDTRLSVSSTGNGGAGRGTAILMKVPGSSSSANGVKINAYTVGGAVTAQSTDLAFDVGLSGTLVERMRITSAGNVGIGTTTVPNTLSVGMASSTTGKGISLTSSAGIEYARFGVINSTVDNTSYIGSISNNNFAIYANNAERMRITSGGNVGIGFTSPAAKLSIRGADNTSSNFSFEAANGSGNSLFIVRNDGNVGIGTASPSTALDVNGVISITAAAPYIQWKNTSNTRLGYIQHNATDLVMNADTGAIGFTNSGGERMRITSGGNVLIGTTTDTGYKLYIAGTLRTSGTALIGDATSVGNSSFSWGFPGTYYGQMQNVSSTVYGIGFGATPTTIGTTVLSYNTSGNVGIGTTSPDQKLTVATSSFPAASFYRDLDVLSVGTAAQRILIGARKGSVFTSGASITGVLEADGNNGNIAFDTLNGGSLAERMRITSGGNVLIGTTTDAGYKLDVNGTGRFLDNLTVNKEGGIIGIDASNNPRIGFVKKSGEQPFLAFASAPFLLKVSSGSEIFASNTFTTVLSIATSGAATFSSTVEALRYNATSSNASLVGYAVTAGNGMFNADTNAIGFSTNSTERMRITSGGNVGIGTTNASGRLTLNNPISDGSVPLISIRDTSNVYEIGYLNFNQSTDMMTLMNKQSYSASGISLGTNNTERMRITSGGNVLIGTTTDNGYKLDVNGSARFSSAVVGTSNVNSNNTKIQIASTAASNKLGFSGGANNITEENLYVWNFTTGVSTGIYFQSNGTITASGGFFNSDMRLKDLTDYDYNVSDIKPITYLWKDGRDNKKHVGYSAQEVQKVMPDAVNEGTDGMLSVNYVEVLVAKIEAMEKEIAYLKSKI